MVGDVTVAGVLEGGCVVCCGVVDLLLALLLLIGGICGAVKAPSAAGGVVSSFAICSAAIAVKWIDNPNSNIHNVIYRIMHSLNYSVAIRFSIVLVSVRTA